ncbi:unnamed protein product [Sphagnum balticum]
MLITLRLMICLICLSHGFSHFLHQAVDTAQHQHEKQKSKAPPVLVIVAFSEVPTTLYDQFEVRCCYNGLRQNPQQPALNSTQLKLRGFRNSAPTNTNPNNQHCATLEQQFMLFNSSTTLHGRFVHFIKHSRDPFAFVRKIQ